MFKTCPKCGRYHIILVFGPKKSHEAKKSHVNQPEKAQHFSFNHPVAQELLICFKPELQNHIKVRFVKMLFQIRPASHIRDIAILNGGDSLELAVIPHRLLQGKGYGALSYYNKNTTYPCNQSTL